MSISAVNFGNNPVNTVQNKTQKKPEPPTLREELAKEGINLPKLTPAQSAVISGATWFLPGLLIDRGMGLMMKNFKTPLKLSLAINGAIGLIAGISTYVKAKNKDN